jgi:trimethylguanosine synthase
MNVPAHKSILIDAFAGAGGNTISFAATGRWKEIIAIDHNAEVLACAKINADIYNVSEKISWHLGDCFEFISSMPQELRDQCVIFASPPWGGKSVSMSSGPCSDLSRS